MPACIEITPEAIEAERKFRYEGDYNFWAECVIDDWKEKLSELGFWAVKISYTGFSCQGDGASFTCESLDDAKLLQLPTPLLQEIETAKTVALATQRLLGEGTKWLDFDFSLGGKVVRASHHYVHAHSIDCELRAEIGNDIPEALQSKIEHWVAEHQKHLTELVQSLSQELYRDLEAAWDDWTSDETITAHLRERD